MNNLGYDRPLYILPFDHRGSFQTKQVGERLRWSDAELWACYAPAWATYSS